MNAQQNKILNSSNNIYYKKYFSLKNEKTRHSTFFRANEFRADDPQSLILVAFWQSDILHSNLNNITTFTSLFASKKFKKGHSIIRKIQVRYPSLTYNFKPVHFKL